MSHETNSERQAVRTAAQLEALRVRRLSRGDAGAARSAGLVPSINNVNTLDSLKVEHLRARCTRLRKNLGVASKALSREGCAAWMLTFTYSDAVEWQPSHVRDCLQRLRVWLKREFGEKLRYVWVLENVERKSGERKGEVRPHYHCVVWMPACITKEDLMLDQRGFWPHGLTNVVRAKAPVKYVMKYASKFENAGDFPKGARCYGVGGLDDIGRRCRRWINWPSFVQARASVNCIWRRAKGGGWLDVGSGELWPSEWGIAAVGKGYTRLVRVRTHPPTGWAPLGPFSFIRGCEVTQ